MTASRFLVFCLAVAASVMALAADELQILHWRIAEDTKVYNRDGSYAGFMAELEHARLARIFIVPGEDADTPMQLVQIEQTWTGTHYTYDRGTMAIIDSSGETGVNVYANLSESGFVFEDAVEYAFFVEVGNYENGEWATAAVSSPVQYTSLSDSVMAARVVNRFGREEYRRWTNVEAYSGWTFTVVPEPSTGLLCLIGLCFLVLVRRPQASMCS